MASELVLYVKKNCPWCVAAERYLDEHGYAYTEIDVLRNYQAFEHMKRISGQRYVPTLVVDDKILPDFGPEELEKFLHKHGILPSAAIADSPAA
ncbi:MAG TPA: glutaredoxin family protein [Chthoniobacterales bacterium]